MPEDYDCPRCPICDEELENNQCADCNLTWNQEELDEHMEKEYESYIAFMKKVHPEMFGNEVHL